MKIVTIYDAPTLLAFFKHHRKKRGLPLILSRTGIAGASEAELEQFLAEKLDEKKIKFKIQV